MGVACMAAHSEVVPSDLPRTDDQPPARNKPVKVYILSGQSNMVGFGTLKRGQSGLSQHLSVGRSECHAVPDAGGQSALLPHRVYQEATGDTQGAKATIYSGAYDPQADYAK